jgi:nitrite reductase/ring-hydroxylating ferredoxin subunit
MTKRTPEVDAALRDFPIERLESEHVTRREFAKVLCVCSGGFALGSGWVATKESILPRHHLSGEVRVCGVEEVAIGSMCSFAIGSTPYILIRLGEEEWSAMEQKCTHLSCAVIYSAATGRVECPCHRGIFDARTGDVLEGPPPRPLQILTVSVRDRSVFVTETRAEAKRA